MRTLTAMFLVAACSSCAKTPAPHVTVTVSGSTSHVLYDNEQSRKELYGALKGLASKQDSPPVSVQLSSDATYALAQNAMDICTDRGLWRISLVDETGKSIEDAYLEWKSKGTQGAEQGHSVYPR